MHRPKDWPLVGYIAFGILALVLQPLWSSFYEEWLRHAAERLGVPVSLIGENVPSLLVAGLIVLFIYRYLERQFSEQLRAALTPALRASFQNNTRCVRPNTTITTQLVVQFPDGHKEQAEHKILSTYYRVAVEATVGVVADCYGTLLSIKRDGMIIADGENVPLTFAPAERSDTTSKRIASPTAELLDVLALTAENRVIVTSHNFAYPSSYDMDHMFDQHGKYEFEIRIAAPSLRIPTDLTLTVEWNGDSKIARVY